MVSVSVFRAVCRFRLFLNFLVALSVLFEFSFGFSFRLSIEWCFFPASVIVFRVFCQFRLF